ncbi:MAG TPA: GNAT family N-acetyltransferase [Candidatus Paceibacterota bacterium]|nr:GNAT family N-acetyltransferase [Candidatus Paceibacterota bacterium]
MNIVDTPIPDFDIYIGKPGTVYAKRGAHDSLASIYEQGYLPYSGTAGLQNIFYTARSVRIALEEFSLSSENRRIARKFDGTFTKERIPFSAFMPDESFWDFCLSYFATKHGPRAMPRARLETIMHSSLITAIVAYRKDADVAAYVLEVEDGAMGHFWFSFYDLAYARQSLGMWLMLDNLRDAQARGLAHYYLGTVYGDKAFYKLNFAPAEWWDESHWSRDIERLKHS